MDQSLRMGRRQPFRDFAANAQHFRQRQPISAAPQTIFEFLALEQFHGQEGNAAVLADLIDGDDMLVFDGSGQLGLAQKTPVEFRVGRQRWLHHLESHTALEVKVLGLEDDPHGAGPQRLADEVGAKAPDFLRRFRRRQEGIIRGRSQFDVGGTRFLRRTGKHPRRTLGSADGAPCPAVEELPFMGACTARLQRGHGFVLPAMLSFI